MKDETRYLILIVIFISFVASLYFGAALFNQRHEDTRSCYSYSVKRYNLDEVPLRCKYQNIIYKDNKPSKTIFFEEGVRNGLEK